MGCGCGLMLISAAKRLKTGKAVGVDIWDSRDQAGNGPENTFKNAQLEGVAERIEIQDSDARQLPFEENTFDVVSLLFYFVAIYSTFRVKMDKQYPAIFQI